MATGIVDALKCTNYSGPISTAFTKSFSANTNTTVTATQASYPAIPDGYYGVLAGCYVDAASILFVTLNPNASGSGNLMNRRNVTSAQNDKACYFRNSLLSSALIQDERNL